MVNAVVNHLRVIHLPCIGHTIQLAVEKAFCLRDIKSALRKVLKLVGCFRKSSIANCLVHKVDSPYISCAFSINNYSFTQPTVNTVNLNLGLIWHIYSFDFSQQVLQNKIISTQLTPFSYRVHFPSDPWWPRPIYFKTPQSCAIFVVYCQCIPMEMNYQYTLCLLQLIMKPKSSKGKVSSYFKLLSC